MVCPRATIKSNHYWIVLGLILQSPAYSLTRLDCLWCNHITTLGLFHRCGPSVLCIVKMQSLKREKIVHHRPMTAEIRTHDASLWLRHWFQCYTVHTKQNKLRLSMSSPSVNPLDGGLLRCHTGLPLRLRRLLHLCLLDVDRMMSHIRVTRQRL